MRRGQGVAQLNVEFVIVDVVQKHVHPRQVVSGVVDLLAEKTVFNNVFVKLLFGLQQQRTGAAGRVIDLIDGGLFVHGELRDEL